MEVGQDVALISFCMCGLNAVDIFNAKKDQYNNGIFHYERQKTRSVRSDRGYFEVRVPPFLKPTFEKYLSKKADSPWLFNFHDRLSTSDSFCANVNIGIKQVWEKVEPGFRASLYAFRHSWATIAQNECGATMNEVDFGLNHSINRMARVYVKIDYTPVWILNEKVIDFVFFTDNESKHIEKEDKSFEERSGICYHPKPVLNYHQRTYFTYAKLHFCLKTVVYKQFIFLNKLNSYFGVCLTFSLY